MSGKCVSLNFERLWAAAHRSSSFGMSVPISTKMLTEAGAAVGAASEQPWHFSACIGGAPSKPPHCSNLCNIEANYSSILTK